MRIGMTVLAACVSLTLQSEASRAAQTAAFEKIAAIPAPDDRWDFASWDDAHHLVLVAHGRDVLVIDPSKPAAVRSIGSLQGAHGVVAIPNTTHLLVTSGRDNTARILDEVTGEEIASIPVAAEPDAVILSADARQA